MPGGGRRLPRTVRSTIHPTVVPFVPGEMAGNKYSLLDSSLPNLPGVEQPPTPKHYPFPNTPIDDELVFEVVMFLYTTTAAALQFLQLYRSVWWLPRSYNSNSVNFYLIDTYLVIFIAIILSRRLLYVLVCKMLEYWTPQKYFDSTCLFYRVFLFGAIVISLSWCAYHVIQNSALINIFYLCYPISVYLILFGLTITPFFELITASTESLPPMHACTSNAADIRAEVDNLKGNFNGRMKQILFSSVLNAYYAALVPCCFAQNFVYYDVSWAAQHVVSLWLGCFSSYAIHILPLRYCDVLHRSALHLGCWSKVQTRSPVAHAWQDDTLWPCGSIVRHGREVYRAIGETNAAEPGNQMYARFSFIFINPSMVLASLLTVQVTLIGFQLILLLRSYFYWYNIVSVALLLFFNYYTLFKIGRDYLISQRIYSNEQVMHKKLNSN